MIRSRPRFFPSLTGMYLVWRCPSCGAWKHGFFFLLLFSSFILSLPSLLGFFWVFPEQGTNGEGDHNFYRGHWSLDEEWAVEFFNYLSIAYQYRPEIKVYLYRCRSLSWSGRGQPGNFLLLNSTYVYTQPDCTCTHLSPSSLYTTTSSDFILSFPPLSPIIRAHITHIH